MNEKEKSAGDNINCCLVDKLVDIYGILHSQATTIELRQLMQSTKMFQHLKLLLLLLLLTVIATPSAMLVYCMLLFLLLLLLLYLHLLLLLQ